MTARKIILIWPKSQLSKESKNSQFFYEPLFGVHPTKTDKLNHKFLGFDLDFPLWVSSMTGGTAKAGLINQNLASVARDFKFGFALGSCRPLLESDQYFEDFNVRKILGKNLPFFANLGIAQIEKLQNENKTDLIHQMVNKLDANGLIIHINPMQEWFQPEGDRFTRSPLETISRFLNDKKYPIIVKEVGQGMGPRSLKALLDLKVDVIEFGAFGGTNFSLLETLRNPNTNHNYSSQHLIKMGHTPNEMVSFLNELLKVNPHYKNTEVIISGGIQNILEGQYYRETLEFNSVIGLAKRFLENAQDKTELYKFVEDECQTLLMAKNYLHV